MTGDDLWLDGNAVAGLLEELLGAEPTRVPRRCQSCGETHPVGAHRLYRGAGLVLRCPNCGDIAARIVALPDRCILQLFGTWRLELSRS
ncbi:MAG: hypothetical protein QOD66_3700 [Solirubrobacteraceae bacterium]|jgi:hypothetical protein|nr:hypothetical protein [Solirubrobacteraceae bacterium]